MTCLYVYHLGSFVLLRQKHEIKLPTQSAEKTDLYGEINIRNLGGIVSQKSEGPRQSDFSGDLHDANASPEKESARKIFYGQRNNSYTASASRHGVIRTFMVKCHPFFATFHTLFSSLIVPQLDPPTLILIMTL